MDFRRPMNTVVETILPMVFMGGRHEAGHDG
jgi:hypothetical protein